MSADPDSHLIAGGLDVAYGGYYRRDRTRPDRDEYDDPPIDYAMLGSSTCATCGTTLIGTAGQCSWPAGAAGRCPVLLRRRAEEMAA